MKSGFKLVLMTLPLVLAGVGFVAYTIASKPAPAQEVVAERATAVRVITATRAAVAPRASGFGLVAPARTYAAISQVTGTAEYVNPALKKGDILPAGAVLVRISTIEYNLAIAQARANIRAAEARLAEFTVSQSNLEAGLDIEQETLALKSAELERIERLFSVGTVSQSTRDGAKTAYLTQLQKVQNLQSSIALLPTQRQVQTEQIAVYQATLATAELNLARTELRLPFAARVDAVSVEVGQLVLNGQTVARLDGIGAAEVEAHIPADTMLKLFRRQAADPGDFTLNPLAIAKVLGSFGIRADIRLNLGDQTIEWPAVLDRISNTIDTTTGTVGVIVRVDNAYTGARLGTRPPLTKGMFVEVTLASKPVEGILVPRSALRGDKIMLADDDSRLKLVPVTTELVQGRVVLVSGGVREGADIVVSAPIPMMQGMLLDLHPDKALSDALIMLGSAE